MPQPATLELLLSAKQGNLEKAQQLLNQGIDPNIQDEEGKTPLIVAASYGRTEMVKFLLNNGANPDMRDNTGCTALIRASRMGYARIVELLLSHGADITIADNNGKTALDRARDWQRQEVIQLIEAFLSAASKAHLQTDPEPTVAKPFGDSSLNAERATDLAPLRLKLVPCCTNYRNFPLNQSQ